MLKSLALRASIDSDKSRGGRAFHSCESLLKYKWWDKLHLVLVSTSFKWVDDLVTLLLNFTHLVMSKEGDGKCDKEIFSKFSGKCSERLFCATESYQ